MDRGLPAFSHSVLYISSKQYMEAIVMNAMRKGVLLVLVVFSMILGLSAVANAQTSLNLTNVSLGAVYLSSDLTNLTKFNGIWHLNSTNFVLNFSITLQRDFNVSNFSFYLPVGVGFGNGSYFNGTTANDRTVGNLTQYDATNRIFTFFNNGTNTTAVTTYYFYFAVNISTSDGVLPGINISFGNRTVAENNFRNITGNITVDTIAPVIASAKTLTNDTLNITFTELNGINSTSIVASRFYVNYTVNATLVDTISGSSVLTSGNNNNSITVRFLRSFPDNATPTLYVNTSNGTVPTNGVLFDFGLNQVVSGSVAATDSAPPAPITNATNNASNTEFNSGNGTTPGILTINWTETMTSFVNGTRINITANGKVIAIPTVSSSVSGNVTTLTLNQSDTDVINAFRGSGLNITLGGGSFNDTSGNVVGAITYTISRFFSDTRAPRNTTAVLSAVGRTFNITFDEAVMAGLTSTNLSRIMLLNQSTQIAAGAGVGWFTLDQAAAGDDLANSSTASSNRTLVILLTRQQAEWIANWSVSTVYYKVNFTAVADVAGNGLDNFTTPEAISSFVDDTTAPTVTATVQNDTSPVKGGTLEVNLTFSEKMNVAVNSTVSVVFGTNNTVGTRPQVLLQNWTNATVYTIQLKLNSTTGDGAYQLNVSSAQDAAANAMTLNTAIGTLDTTAPVILYAWYEESGSLEDATPYDNVKQHGDRILLFMSEDMTNQTVAALTNLTDSGLTNSTTFRLLENSSSNNVTVIPAINYTATGRIVSLDIGGNNTMQLRSRTTFQFAYPLAQALTINDLAGNPANTTPAVTIADYAVSMVNGSSTYFGASACMNPTFINTWVSNYSVSGSIQKYLGSWATVLSNATKANEGYRIQLTGFAERIRQTGNRMDYPIWANASCDLTTHAVTVAAGYNLIAVDGFNKTTGAATTGVDQWLDSVNAGSHDFAHLINATNNVQYFGPTGWDTLIVNPYDTYWAWKTDQSDLFAGFGRT